jgi:TnpA family transposase
MARRRVLTDEQLKELLALPATEPVLIRHWTLSPADLAAVERRRGDPNQLGFALQLCAFRYPGRLLRSEEAIPVPALRFVADQLGVAPGALTAYAARAPLSKIKRLPPQCGTVVRSNRGTTGRNGDGSTSAQKGRHRSR